MKRKIKNLLCVILVLTMILLALSSCASEEAGNNEKSGGDDNNTPGQSGGDEEEAVDENARLPFEPTVIDLGGRNFVIGAASWGTELTSDQRDVFAEKDTGDSINDAVYTRNAVTGEIFNCTIVEDKYTWPGDLGSAIRKAVNGGLSTFDAAFIRYGDNLSPLSTAGMLMDLKHLPNLELSNQWWDQNSVKSLSIADRLFAVTGDIQILDKGSLSAFVFNKQLQADYQIENLYSLVKDGKWTFPKMLEISKLISDDLNGDGVMDENDRYGLLYYRDAMPAFLAATGECIARKDADDMPYMSFNTEKVYNALDLIYEVIYDDTVSFHTQKNFGESDTAQFIQKGVNMFQKNQALLMYVRMTEIEELRGMDTDFGILPFPKYDEAQSSYISCVNSYIGSALVVPATADPEVSGAVLEAMAYESRYTLMPAYYQVTLKTKVGRDEESEEMLDLIFKNITYDLGGLFRFGGIESGLMNNTTSFTPITASFYEKNESKAIKDIDKVVEKYLGLD